MGSRILIAEDEPNIVVSLEFLLGSAGHEVMVARDGEEALRLAAAAEPDLVVLDVMLPIVSGFEVCRRIRASPAGARIGILMLTARGQERERSSGLACGANAYLTKPFSTRELLAVVARLIERSQRA